MKYYVEHQFQENRWGEKIAMEIREFKTEEEATAFLKTTDDGRMGSYVQMESSAPATPAGIARVILEDQEAMNCQELYDLINDEAACDIKGSIEELRALNTVKEWLGADDLKDVYLVQEEDESDLFNYFDKLQNIAPILNEYRGEWFGMWLKATLSGMPYVFENRDGHWSYYVRALD